MREDQIVNPWRVKATGSGDKTESLNYIKVIEQFGCQYITKEIVEKLKLCTNIPVHHFITRNIVFAHRDFEKILDMVLKNSGNFYLYTGRGPSSQSMHVGHAIPFLFCKYLQDAFNVPLVIQITDDEKFLWKNLTYENSLFYAKENIKDIIAFGFKPENTFIFTNTGFSHRFIENNLKIGKSVSFREAAKVFGFDENFSISQIEFPAKEISPCFSTSFKDIKFIKENSFCLIPAAIDQDPFFRLARDKANVINGRKPATVYSKFLPDLCGTDGKMSASDQNSAILLSDTKENIKKKIMKYAFSGGRDTLKEHREFGGNLEVDIPYHYLTYFLEDDEKLKKIAHEYSTGAMTSGEIKKICVDVLANFVESYQEKRKLVTDQCVSKFMSFE
ncbi:tryptophan-tRNA ligase [Edhazardia aedis USNM 41457]|uniref:tryptophan--tRNA ligase n=1 Tax=Edhazardia aedis (strain USNM 41457) TaxID=1003232 RepID=J9D649_EDHAE|nr:tryptophan-tRNA ligase [Edhazardia aedis USNM 41457]|eukprot:EJW03266.1 tryptophan-tRNA ligase [Edhazardia aedis USNM 41457]